MSLKVGDKVRIKSKEWYDKNKDENGEIKNNDIVFGKYQSEFCGLTMDINSLKDDMYYLLTISKNCHFESAILCCEDWFEPISDGWLSTDNDEELKKSVIVNVPIDMEVSTHESNGRITINVQHKNNEVEDCGRVKNGETYWHITGLGTIISSIEYFDPMDNILYNLKNYFKTEELAKKALPEYKDFFKNLNIK